MPNIQDLYSPSLSHSVTHSHAHSHTQLTIKPLVSFDVGVPVTVTHQFLLVLLHQAVKPVPIPPFEMLLSGFDHLGKKTK